MVVAEVEGGDDANEAMQQYANRRAGVWEPADAEQEAYYESLYGTVEMMDDDDASDDDDELGLPVVVTAGDEGDRRVRTRERGLELREHRRQLVGGVEAAFGDVLGVVESYAHRLQGAG